MQFFRASKLYKAFGGGNLHSDGVGLTADAVQGTIPPVEG